MLKMLVQLEVSLFFATQVAQEKVTLMHVKVYVLMKNPIF